MRALALIAMVSIVAVPALAQETAQPIPPEHQQRMYGPSYEQRAVTDPNVRAAQEFPHLSGKPPAAAPVPSVVPPPPRCNPSNSTIPSYDPQNSATSPPSCP